MAKTSKATEAKKTTEKLSVGKRIKTIVASFFKKITAPVRNNKAWKFLRRTILRSPFRGYFVDSWRELRKVSWPNRKTSIRLTTVVVLFAVLFSAFTTAVDYGFENLAKRIFLN